MNEPNCPTCPLRRRYDNRPASLLGRVWRWHINWCPGWKSYISGVPAEERESLRKMYGLK